MKLPHVLQNLLTNKIVLNIVCVLSALNMIGYLVTNNLTAILFFIVLAILIVQFNKNMIIVLGIPLILVNFFVALGMSKRIEGNQNMGDVSKDTTTNMSDVSKDGDKQMTQEQKDTIKNVNKKDKVSGQGLPITPIEPTEATDEAFEVGRAKRRGAGNQIDYAATVEGAYDELNSILGSEGIKRLTDDTQKLMKQQLQLAESMKGMGPMIEGLGPMMKQAQDLLGGMGDGKGMSEIMEMAKKFKPN